MGKVEAYREPLQRDEARHEAGAQLVHALGVLGAARAHERLELLHHRLREARQLAAHLLQQLARLADALELGLAARRDAARRVGRGARRRELPDGANRHADAQTDEGGREARDLALLAQPRAALRALLDAPPAAEAKREQRPFAVHPLRLRPDLEHGGRTRRHRWVWRGPTPGPRPPGGIRGDGSLLRGVEGGPKPSDAARRAAGGQPRPRQDGHSEHAAARARAPCARRAWRGPPPSSASWRQTRAPPRAAGRRARPCRSASPAWTCA